MYALPLLILSLAVCVSGAIPAISTNYDPHNTFAKIIDGTDPKVYKVYEDDHVLGFLKLRPGTTTSVGESLLVPKLREHELFVDLPVHVTAHMGAVLPVLMKAIMLVTGADGAKINVNIGKAGGQGIMHPHFHLVPFYSKGDRLCHSSQTVKLANDAKAIREKVAELLAAGALDVDAAASAAADAVVRGGGAGGAAAGGGGRGEENAKLSPGAIAAIAAGVVAVLGGGGYFLYRIMMSTK